MDDDLPPATKSAKTSSSTLAGGASSSLADMSNVALRHTFRFADARTLAAAECLGQSTKYRSAPKCVTLPSRSPWRRAQLGCTASPQPGDAQGAQAPHLPQRKANGHQSARWPSAPPSQTGTISP